MSKKNLLDSWKAYELKTNDENGVNVNEDLLRSIQGGGDSAGYVCTVSGECNGTGKSCQTIEGWLDHIF